jgi:hypothetical protein
VLAGALVVAASAGLATPIVSAAAPAKAAPEMARASLFFTAIELPPLVIATARHGIVVPGNLWLYALIAYFNITCHERQNQY